MSTADLSIIVNGVEVLAAIGTIGALFYAKRLLFAASPKPQAPPQSGETKAKDKPKDKPAAEQPPAGGDRPLSILGGESIGEAV